MKAAKVLAIALILAGALGLAYGGFSYFRTRNTTIGPIVLSVKDRQRVNVPIWLSVTAVVCGAVLLVVPKKG